MYGRIPTSADLMTERIDVLEPKVDFDLVNDYLSGVNAS